MAKRFCPLLAAASLAGAFLWPAEALSATITVMNADDGGPGSLRAALAAAADGDTIVFASGLSGIPILLTSGELSITKDLDIAGHGPGATILDGNASSRVISVGQDADVTLAGLTIRSGVAKIGAGILNGGRLTLENSAVEGNRCDEMNESGCGIYNSGILTVRSSTISDNSCACYPPVCHCEGAGMVNMGVANLTASIVAHNTSVVCGGIQNFSELTMVQSLVSENVAIPGEGGGLCVSGKVVLISTSVTDNYAGLQGAGISSHGDLTLDHSLVARNSTNHEGGGGIYNGGYLALLNSEISDNRANTFGGGVYNLGTMRSVGTTVSTNVGLAWAGGGIANGGQCALLNSTVSGNYGDGIFNTGSLEVSNTTIAGNRSKLSELGGGIANGRPSDSHFPGGTVLLRNSLIAWNSNNEPGSTDCSGEITSLGHNLVSDVTGCIGLTNGVAGDIVGVDPSTVVDPVLADNGGPTPTHALLPGSPAIDHIALVECVDTRGSPVSADQRAIPRPQGPGCDIGSFEAQMPRGAIFWKRQCSDNGPREVDSTQMEGFLSKVREQSEAFPECADATCATFWTNGKRDPRRFAAARELLAVWLNVVSGRLPSSSPVNLPGLTTATTVSGAIHEIEGILCNPSASSADLKAAEELARALNLNNL